MNRGAAFAQSMAARLPPTWKNDLPVILGMGIGAAYGAKFADDNDHEDSTITSKMQWAGVGLLFGAAGGAAWPVTLVGLLTYKILKRKPKQANPV